jgi:F0F1-type ATP synthase epsilon subunit
MKAIIRTLNSELKEENFLSLVVPATKGEIEILPGHAKAFFLLTVGNLKLRKSSGTEKIINVQHGVCWVDEEVTILFEPATRKKQ